MSNQNLQAEDTQGPDTTRDLLELNRKKYKRTSTEDDLPGHRPRSIFGGSISHPQQHAQHQSGAAAQKDSTNVSRRPESQSHRHKAITEIQEPLPSIITLDIGGRKFQTDTENVCFWSGLLRKDLKSEGHSRRSAQADGSYFYDMDPDIFEHLLRFMRCPEVYPLFYSKDEGFDYDLYNRVQAAAQYFQIDALDNWINDKKYLQAVKYRYETPRVFDSEDVPMVTLQANQNLRRHVFVIPRKVYVCPRGIECHRGRRDRCGRQCQNAQEGNEVDYDTEQEYKVVQFAETLVIDDEVCREHPGPES